MGDGQAPSTILTPEHYDKARETIAASGFDAAMQTKIALFLGAAKSVNAAILGAVECSRRITIAYPSSTQYSARNRIRGVAGARHALVVELGDLCPGRQAGDIAVDP